MLRRFGRIVLGVTSVLCGILLAGCGGKGYTCRSNSATCGKSSQTCCSEKDCYYSYAGNKYQCDGTDCAAAAERVVVAMCAGAPGALTQDAAQALKQTTSELAAKARGSRCPVCP